MAIGLLSSVGSIGAVSIPTAVGWLADKINLEIITMMIPLAVAMVMLHRSLVKYAPVEVDIAA
ncbi:hypothetical protein [Argonema antarcticum]|uniref:hypothetical protein n=1 Tax=Argonema antarcticum TaxID=2942763 RepID=UPI002012B426|nr:hypothetical protein [Argonema antarcticum]MCL1475815.1 hypothetical protein [Argonema antarcticum A004/B2]